MLVSFLKPEGNFKKNLSIFRLLLSKFELINNPKKGQPILGHDRKIIFKRTSLLFSTEI